MDEREREQFEAWAAQKLGKIANESLAFVTKEMFWEAWLARAALAPAQPLAWRTEDGRVISAEQKAQAERDGGASASSVRTYSIPLGLIAPAQPIYQVQTIYGEWIDIDKGMYDRYVEEHSTNLACRYLRTLYAAPSPTKDQT